MTTTQNSLDKYAPDAARKIAKRLVQAALDAGYAINVYDGEETTVKQSRDKATILDAMATTEGDALTFWLGDTRIGTVWLIYCNDEDVISDWSSNETMDALLAPFTE
jgi:hypothetical protein